MTADQLRRLAVLIERTDYEAIDRAAAYLRACADALDAEPVAWMYPDDYERMKTSETFCTVFSVKVVSPDRGSTTVQLYPLAMPAAPTPPVQQDDEAERLRAALTKANNQAEHFEREWYLRGDEIERLRSGRNELEAAISNALPGVRYMDPPDGGSPSLAEQLRRMATDAERYRWLRGDSCMDHSARWTQWEVRRWDAPIWTNDLRRADLDAAIDDAMRKEPDHAR